MTPDARRALIDDDSRKLRAIDKLAEAHALADALEVEAQRLRLAGLDAEGANAALLAWTAAFLLHRFGSSMELRSSAAAGRLVGRSLGKLAPR